MDISHILTGPSDRWNSSSSIYKPCLAWISALMPEREEKTKGEIESVWEREREREGEKERERGVRGL